MSEITTTDNRLNGLFAKVSDLIEQARKRVTTTVNVAEVYTKYHIGQYIVEDEQQGEQRAQYGKQVLRGLSERLTNRFGSGWSYETLATCKKFYVVYSNSVNTVYKIPSQKANFAQGCQHLRISLSALLARQSFAAGKGQRVDCRL